MKSLKFHRHFQVAAPNRWEFYASFAAAAFGAANMGLPINYREALLFAASMVVASFCALNAALDFRRLSPGKNLPGAVGPFVGLCDALDDLERGHHPHVCGPLGL